MDRMQNIQKNKETLQNKQFPVDFNREMCYNNSVIIFIKQDAR